MRARPLILLAALLLAGCGSQQALRARAWAAGRDIAELEACMGVPAHTDALGNGDRIAQWDYTEPATQTTLPLADLALLPLALPISLAGAGSVAINGSGSCHAIATVRDGHVTGLRYSGDNGGVSGRDAVCAPIVRECLQP